VQQRYLLMFGAAISLVAGIWAGLIRIGWWWKIPSSALLAAHGPLMVCAFLGTLIGLERAVALDTRWGYIAPALAAVGGIILLVGTSELAARICFAIASAAFVCVTAAFLRKQRADFLIAQVLAGIAWLIGNVQWLSGSSIADVVPAWMAFLVLTIAAERLELSRVVQHSRWAHRSFALIAACWAAVPLLPRQLEWHATGVATISTAVWMARYDIARWTIRSYGLARFAATALLVGYGWLIVSGILLLWQSSLIATTFYDAVLHAVFVGFVFSMIFAHAPIVLPAVLGILVVYRANFYVPLALLHAGMLMRLTGDVLLHPHMRRWGALLSSAAIALYVVVAIANRFATPSSQHTSGR
jgi:hypothetical protein